MPSEILWKLTLTPEEFPWSPQCCRRLQPNLGPPSRSPVTRWHCPPLCRVRPTRDQHTPTLVHPVQPALSIAKNHSHSPSPSFQGFELCTANGGKTVNHVHQRLRKTGTLPSTTWARLVRSNVSRSWSGVTPIQRPGPSLCRSIRWWCVTPLASSGNTSKTWGSGISRLYSSAFMLSSYPCPTARVSTVLPAWSG